MLALFIALFLAFNPRPVHAQNIPLFHQLLFAYHSQSTPSLATTVTPSPLALSSDKNNTIWAYQPQVLGVSTSATQLPAIGGDGKVTTIALFGDSMIDTLGPGVPQLESALKTYYPSKVFNILNYGVGSSGIDLSLNRLSSAYEYRGDHFPSLVSQNPDIIVIESFAYNNFGNDQKGIDRHWLALGALTTKIKELLPQTKIVLSATIAPNSINFGDGIKDLSFSSLDKIEKSSTVKLYLQNLINFANSQHFPLANAYTPSLKNNDGNPVYISPADNLHPSGQGAQLYAQIVAKSIFDNQLLDN